MIKHFKQKRNMQIYNRSLYTQTINKNFFQNFFNNIKMESTSQNNNINAIKDARKLFNDVRNNLFNEETKRIRKELYKKEAVYIFLSREEYMKVEEIKIIC